MTEYWILIGRDEDEARVLNFSCGKNYFCIMAVTKLFSIVLFIQDTKLF